MVATLVPVVRREPERQQLLLRHGAARVVPETQTEAVEVELGLPLSKIRRVIPLPLGCPRERRGVVAGVASEAATAAATSALRPPAASDPLSSSE
jgi:hypothetical protein